MPQRTRFEPVRIRSEGQSEARLVFFDERLVAIVARLDADQGDFARLWYSELALNGLDPMRHEVFDDLESVALYVEQRLAAH